MAGLNKMTIIGHLGRDPEVRITNSGMSVTNFSVAVTEKSKGEEKTLWFKVITFDSLANICGEYLKKGRQVYIEGRLQLDEWTDRDGKTRTSLEIVANSMIMLGSGNGTSTTSTSSVTGNSVNGTSTGAANNVPTGAATNDVPF